jgi:hypothetical protein
MRSQGMSAWNKPPDKVTSPREWDIGPEPEPPIEFHCNGHEEWGLLQRSQRDSGFWFLFWSDFKHGEGAMALQTYKGSFRDCPRNWFFTRLTHDGHA